MRFQLAPVPDEAAMARWGHLSLFVRHIGFRRYAQPRLDLPGKTQPLLDRVESPASKILVVAKVRSTNTYET